MRIPFSFFLMPVFWFALINVKADLSNAILAFIVIHLFLYPASNGYNSYFDRDEESIGGLKNPPKVTKELWYLVLIFDFLALLVASMINVFFASMIFVYMLISKAYSWDKTRLKKYPIAGAFTVITFQGFWIYWAVQSAVSESQFFTRDNLILAIVSSLFLLGSYPMTQIYQHEADAKHGDRSLSLMLGVNGTFIFSSIIFFIASALMIMVFIQINRLLYVWIYLAALIPVNIYFLSWYNQFRKGKPVITYEKTMRLNQISSVALSAAFILMKILR